MEDKKILMLKELEQYSLEKSEDIHLYFSKYHSQNLEVIKGLLQSMKNKKEYNIWLVNISQLPKTNCDLFEHTIQFYSYSFTSGRYLNETKTDLIQTYINIITQIEDEEFVEVDAYFTNKILDKYYQIVIYRKNC